MPRCCGASHLRALDVVVQIVPERVDQVDGVVSSTGIGVAREQHCIGRDADKTSG